MENVIGIVLGGGQGKRLYPLTKIAQQTGGAAGRQIPDHRHPDQQLPEFARSTGYLSSRSSIPRLSTNISCRPTSSTCSARDSSTSWPPNRLRTIPTGFREPRTRSARCIKHFAPYDVDYVLVLSGDQLYRMDFRQMLRVSRGDGSGHHRGGNSGNGREASGLGIMKVENERKSGRLHAKSPGPKRCTICAIPRCRRRQIRRRTRASIWPAWGFTSFSKDFLIDLLSKSTAIDFGKELFPEAIGKQRFFATCSTATGRISGPSGPITKPTWT